MILLSRYPIASQTSATIVLKAIQFVPSNLSFSENVVSPFEMLDIVS